MQAVCRAVATDVGGDKMFNQFGMKTLMAVSLCIAAGLTVQAHAVPITYNVNIGSSPDTVTGTITTDGNTGNLSPSDFVSWDITIKDGTSTFELTQANSTYDWFGPVGSPKTYDAITATATSLYEDFNPADGEGNESSVGLGSDSPDIISLIGSVLGSDQSKNGFTLYYPATSNLNKDFFIDEPAALVGIGTAATPLPAALPLFAGGLGMIGLFAGRRKRKALLLREQVKRLSPWAGESGPFFF
jgi:hypothetical protein